MKKIIHVDQHAIRHNIKNPNDQRPPISVKTYKSNHKTMTAEVDGKITFVYRPDKPLSCGARLWAETRQSVTLEDGTIL